VNRGLYHPTSGRPRERGPGLRRLLSLRSRSTAGKTFETISPAPRRLSTRSGSIPEPQEDVAGRGRRVAVSHDRERPGSTRTISSSGQFYQIYADNREPFYYLGGGLQDNGTWTGPSRTRGPFGILNEDWRMRSSATASTSSRTRDPEVFLSSSGRRLCTAPTRKPGSDRREPSASAG
jgi:hypothetical protein